ncbi:hypothetical protein ACFRCI_14090 [Streptomyces sp. NPDC056638]|uniref:hypothetical protein n=1 Tax=Streptomyces sp. NPDC056638 TaxID=3345887 RepID=UPI0036B95FE7
MLCIRGVVLPEREERTFWIDGEVLRAGGPPGGLAGRDAETIVDGGRLLPGLVDVHTHLGALEPGAPFDEELLRPTRPRTPPRWITRAGSCSGDASCDER